MIKNGDLVELKRSGNIGIVIDSLEKDFFTPENLARAYRKVLIFDKNNISIEFLPSCDIELIQKKGSP